ncbi:MAG: relaxase/mobilization nuclease domain-containing protein [Lentisphaerae bacterium]|nr:relaxase/mobilization nuclease domain-containing protein [Lentisphaerota bacterium]
MATTSIWAVKGWLGQVVIYAENPEKTANPACYEKEGMTAAQAQGLSDVIDYAAQTRKTGLMNEHTEVMQHFVTGINCQPETARAEMMATKKHYGKDEGVVAYHGYQSFAPGEATPEIAHEIGVRLAQRLWGDRHQVIVATHLDKVNHLHNHFVLNNVSMVDGRKYYRSNQDYYNMQRESDSLCREYSLSVIENPKPGKSKHYGEWKAEQDGRQTWRGIVKSDVDAAIRGAMTERQFWDNLRKLGYEIKQGKDISLRPPGKERFVRLCRNFGEDYTIENIRRRILAQARPERHVLPPDPPPQKVHLQGTFHKARRMTGLRALYFYYLYRMGVLPKKREPNPKRVYFLFREDIRFIQNIARETRLLAAHSIDTSEQLAAHKGGLASQFKTLCTKRKRLRYQARGVQDEEKAAALKAEIAALSMKIGELRREVKLCEDIETRSGVMRDKIRRAQEDEKTQGKELTRYEPLRGRR